jgi:hypothetical protein
MSYFEEVFFLISLVICIFAIKGDSHIVYKIGM